MVEIRCFGLNAQIDRKGGAGEKGGTSGGRKRLIFIRTIALDLSLAM